MKLSRLITALIAFAMLSPAASAQSRAAAMPDAKVTTQTAHTDLTQKEQWHNLRRWVSLTFDRSNVIDMEDAERGTMVIKWSCPVQIPSDFINASVQLTYVIDVRDGKYRLQRLNPRVSYQILRPEVYDSFDSDRAAAASSDIQLINAIARHSFDGVYEWPVDETYEQIVSDFLATASSTPQYRNDRDRERGKISDDWRKAEHNWKLVAKPLLTLRQLDNTMSASLDEALKTKDDF